MPKKEILPESANNYVAPRNEPLKYPGIRPERSFILNNGNIHPILYDDQEKGRLESTYSGRAVIDNEGNTKGIDNFLKSQGKTPLGERYAVLGFGSNPVPGQLMSKLGEDTVVPVIFGEMKDTDVVYNIISVRGYVFAELAFDQIGIKGSVAITFLDYEQLQLMNRTEQNYDLAFIPKEVILESGEKIYGGKNDVAGLFYAGKRKIWVPERHDGPVAIAELPSTGRNGVTLNQEGTLDLIVDEFNLSSRGIHSGVELAQYIRTETNQDKPNKLKDFLQHSVFENPKSLEPVNSQVTTLKNPSEPPKVFGDN